MIIEHGTLEGTRVDYEVQIMRTRGVHFYLDLELRDDLALALRFPRKRHGFQVLIAAGALRVYFGVGW